MIRFHFDRKYVPLVAPFVPKRDIRYYLNGLRIEAAGDRDGVYIVGCDGHRLTVAYDKDGKLEGDDGAGLIMRMPRQLVSACKASSSVPLKVVCHGDHICVGDESDVPHGALETYVLPGKPWIEGNYPKWRQVLPCWDKLKPGFTASVQTQYLEDYAKLGEGGVIFWQENPSTPIVVQHDRHPEVVSILMPRRFDEFDKKNMFDRLARVAAGAKVAP